MIYRNRTTSSYIRAALPDNTGVKIMFLRKTFTLLMVLLMAGISLGQTNPDYKSIVEWNGPYYHVRHGLNATQDYVDYQVNDPLPQYSSPFSSPTAVSLFGTASTMTIFVVDHDQNRVQVFSGNIDWVVEELSYFEPPIQGLFGGDEIMFTQGGIVPGSERILVNGEELTRVNDVSGYSANDNVYSIVYTGNPGVGGVATLPTGRGLDVNDRVEVEYAFSTSPASAGVGEIDYILSATTPTDIPLQMTHATSSNDPSMNDLTSIATRSSARGGRVADIYLVNALSNADGSLASYDLTNISGTGQFSWVDTYPGYMLRPYDVEIVTLAANVDATVADGAFTGVNTTQVTESIINQNTYLAHDYLVEFSFDTSYSMNAAVTDDNEEVDLAYSIATGRLHMVFTEDGTVGKSMQHSYSDDLGENWSAPQTLSPAAHTGVSDRPRIAIQASGKIHAVWESVVGQRNLYHSESTDGGLTWSVAEDISADIVPGTESAAAYANLVVDADDNVHLVYSGDENLYHAIYTGGSWSSSTLVATGANPGNFCAPHAVSDGGTGLFVAFVSDITPPGDISFILYNGTVWGSNDGGLFGGGTTDEVTSDAGVANVSGLSIGETIPLPQICVTGDSVWVFWVGDGTETYGVDDAEIRYNLIAAHDGDFTSGGGTIVNTGGSTAPAPFAVKVDANRDIHIAYPVYGGGSGPDQEALNYKIFDYSAGAFVPAVGAVGREIFEGGVANQSAPYPRLIIPNVAGQIVPMLACAKNYPAAGMGSGSFNATFKIIDGVVTITDQTDQSVINNFRVWTTGNTDAAAIPGLSFTITNSASAISNTDNVDATEFNLGDSFVLDATLGEKNDLLFVTDSDQHKIKTIRAYGNIDNWGGGDTRWDVPGKSDYSPGQTYVLATIGDEGSFTVWASQDSIPWTEVQDLSIAGVNDRYYELDRFTKELRFGDNVHGAIPDSLAFIRVRYEESVDQSEFGGNGQNLGELSYPRGVAVAWNSHLGHYDVYVCDTGNDRLQKFVYDEDSTVDPNEWGSPLCTWNYVTDETGLLSDPQDIEVVIFDSEVYLVVTDATNNRIVIYKDIEATGNGGTTPPVFFAETGEVGTKLDQWIDLRGCAVVPEDSGLVILAADGDRDIVQKIMSREWLVAESDTSEGGTGGATNFTLALHDELDDDLHLLLQPGVRRTIRMDLTAPDSLVALNVQCAFDTSMITVVSINEGNLWNGESFTSKPFFSTIDNSTGTFQISTSMVGDADGLSTAGTRIVATMVVEAKSTMAIPSEGTISYSTTQMRDVMNALLVLAEENSMTLHGGYLADIADDDGSPGTIPNMIPQPDGKINFSDVNIFTQGWNGDGVVFDPLADIGPYEGETVPDLVSFPDGEMNAMDLLALQTMYDWYATNGTVTLSVPDNGPARSGANLDDSGFIAVQARQNADGWTFTFNANDIQDLTSAHLYLEFDQSSTITAVTEGGFLREGGNALFLHTERGNITDISMGRLNPRNPSVSGTGILAVVEVASSGEMPSLRLVYDLRSSGNNVIDAGDIADTYVDAIPLEFSLEPAYPNPFNAATNFTLNIAELTQVKLTVFNILGQEVATILNKQLAAGQHRLLWEARADNGTALVSGVYFVQMETLGHVDVQKIVLLR
jgi:hypothetical protein